MVWTKSFPNLTLSKPIKCIWKFKSEENNVVCLELPFAFRKQINKIQRREKGYNLQFEIIDKRNVSKNTKKNHIQTIIRETALASIAITPWCDVEDFSPFILPSFLYFIFIYTDLINFISPLFNAEGITGLNSQTFRENWSSDYQKTNNAGIPQTDGSVTWDFK